MTKKTTARPLPLDAEAWVAEIRLALKDARATKPFALLTGTILTETRLFHLAPQVAFKFRGLDLTDLEKKRVVEATLANYVVLTDRDDRRHVAGLEGNPELAFALCYVASHYFLDLVPEGEVGEIMACCEKRLGEQRGRR